MLATLPALLPPPAPAPHLRVVFSMASGVDRLAPFGWLPPGVALLNNRGAHGAKVEAYCLWALAALAQGIPRFVSDQRSQTWLPRFSGVLDGVRVLVVGTGDLGRASARAARRLGMIATGVNTAGRAVADVATIRPVAELDSALAGADILVLAAPLTPNTKGLLDARRLALLPAGAAVLNIARGGLLDAAALVAALRSGALGGAILDVTDPEPPATGDPLWHAPGLMLTPHVSADDPAGYVTRSLAILRENVACLARGEPAPNAVDVGRGY